MGLIRRSTSLKQVFGTLHKASLSLPGSPGSAADPPSLPSYSLILWDWNVEGILPLRITDRTHKHKPQLSGWRHHDSLQELDDCPSVHVQRGSKLRQNASLGIYLTRPHLPVTPVHFLPGSTTSAGVPKLSFSTWTGSMTNFPSSTRHSTEPLGSSSHNVFRCKVREFPLSAAISLTHPPAHFSWRCIN